MFSGCLQIIIIIQALAVLKQFLVLRLNKHQHLYMEALNTMQSFNKSNFNWCIQYISIVDVMLGVILTPPKWCYWSNTNTDSRVGTTIQAHDKIFKDPELISRHMIGIQESICKQSVQWIIPKRDTIGELRFVLYKEVSLIQGFLNACLLLFETWAMSIIHKVSAIQGYPLRGKRGSTVYKEHSNTPNITILPSHDALTYQVSKM